MRRLFKNMILLFLIIVGTILIWRGVWEVSEEMFGPITSIVLGALILIAVGYHSRRILLDHI